MQSPKPRILAAVSLLLLVVVTAGCTSPSGRPTTPARLSIVAPEPHAVVPGTDVVVRVQLAGARVVASSGAGDALRPDRGHVHLYVDGQPTLMSYSLEATIPRLAPGPHTIRAEFVATDHAPFANPVVAAVTVTAT
jgi:hypothetical protein